MSSMLRPIESMRILRAKIVSFGGAAPRSWLKAIVPNAPAQNPTMPIMAATRAQRRFPTITHLLQPPSRPRSDVPVRRKPSRAPVDTSESRSQGDRKAEHEHLPRRRHTQLQTEVVGERSHWLIAMIGPNP